MATPDAQLDGHEARVPPADPVWKSLLEVLTALAGIAVVFYFVGALLMSVRLWALGLPMEASLALLPNQTLAVADGRALLPGLGALIVVLLLGRWFARYEPAIPLTGRNPADEPTESPANASTAPKSLRAPFTWAGHRLRRGATRPFVALSRFWAEKANRPRLCVVAAEVSVAVGAAILAIQVTDRTVIRAVLALIVIAFAFVAVAHVRVWLHRPRFTRLDTWTLTNRKRLKTALFMVFLVGVPVTLALWTPQSTLTLVVTAVLAVVGAAAAVLLARVTFSREQAYELLALVVLLGTALQLVDEAAPPTRLDFAVARMKSGDITDGYFVGGSKKAVYLAPNVADRLVGTMTSLPRSEITSLSLQPSDAVSQLTGEVNERVVGGGSRSSAIEQSRQDDLYSVLASIRADQGWVYPPVLSYDTSQFLKHQYNLFTTDTEHDWVRGRPLVKFDNLAVDPQLFVGENPGAYATVEDFDKKRQAPYAFRGLLTETAVSQRKSASHTETRLFVIRSARNRDSEA